MWFKVSYQAWNEKTLQSFSSLHLRSLRLEWHVCVASVWASLSLKATLVSHTCHQTRITCHVHWPSVEPAKKPRNERICGENVEVPPLTSYWKKEEETVCWLWVTSNLWLPQHRLWKQTAFKSAVSDSSPCNPQLSLCIMTPFSALMELLIPRC